MCHNLRTIPLKNEFIQHMEVDFMNMHYKKKRLFACEK